MQKIIKLDKNLANQIAAWEVVERPLSVVKELVENSIDAWSTSIKIELQNWWIDEIIISDNWEWIDEKDLEIVTQKYTTSKIKTIEDLYNVMTFGFRWEALSSISSVSNFKIISKTIDCDFGSFFETSAWDNENIWKIASETWTKIIVRNLFFNTPARLNYLKKANTEYSKIREFVEQIALSYPKIAFELLNDNKSILKYRENENLKTRIYNIYWEKFSNNLLELNYELVWLKITGYITDPKIAFTNKNRQVLFVNNRIIKSPLIIKSISDAYNRFIPHSEHPGYVLNIKVDPTQVDVNVHPRKLEVRFAQESQIFRWFYHAIEDKLNSVSLLDMNFGQTQGLPLQNNSRGESCVHPKEEKYYTGSGTKFKSYSPYKDTNPNPSQWRISHAINFSKEIMNPLAPLSGGIESFSSPDKGNWGVHEFEKSTDLYDTPIWKIIWQMHNSYILVQTRDWIKILDQHALAERIIYEKLLKNSRQGGFSPFWFSVQWLLIWESIKLWSIELNILQENTEVFNEMWFDFEVLDAWIIIINWVPDFIKKEDLSKIFTWIIDDIWEQSFSKSNSLQEVRNKIFAYASCRAAIKFGHKLNLFEMNKLLNDAVMDYSATCPHGRPVVYEINLEELKWKYER